MYNSQHPIDDEIFGGNQQLKDFAHYCLNNRPISDIRKYVALHNKELLNHAKFSTTKRFRLQFCFEL